MLTNRSIYNRLKKSTREVIKMRNNKIVFVVPYISTYTNRTRYTVHYTERKAKEWGFRRMAKTGEHFQIIPMTEKEAFALR